MLIRHVTKSIHTVEYDDGIAAEYVVSIERDNRKSEVWRAAAPNVDDFWPDLRVASTLVRAGAMDVIKNNLYASRSSFWITVSWRPSL